MKEDIMNIEIKLVFGTPFQARAWREIMKEQLKVFSVCFHNRHKKNRMEYSIDIGKQTHITPHSTIYIDNPAQDENIQKRTARKCTFH